MKTTPMAPERRPAPRHDAGSTARPFGAPEAPQTDKATLYAFYYLCASILLMLLFFIAVPFAV